MMTRRGRATPHYYACKQCGSCHVYISENKYIYMYVDLITWSIYIKGSYYPFRNNSELTTLQANNESNGELGRITTLAFVYYLQLLQNLSFFPKSTYTCALVGSEPGLITINISPLFLQGPPEVGLGPLCRPGLALSCFVPFHVAPSRYARHVRTCRYGTVNLFLGLNTARGMPICPQVVPVQARPSNYLRLGMVNLFLGPSPTHGMPACLRVGPVQARSSNYISA